MHLGQAVLEQLDRPSRLARSRVGARKRRVDICVRQRRQHAGGAHLFELRDRGREVTAAIGKLTQARTRPGRSLGIARRLGFDDERRELDLRLGRVLLQPKRQLRLGQP